MMRSNKNIKLVYLGTSNFLCNDNELNKQNVQTKRDINESAGNNQY